VRRTAFTVSPRIPFLVLKHSFLSFSKPSLKGGWWYAEITRPTDREILMRCKTTSDECRATLQSTGSWLSKSHTCANTSTKLLEQKWLKFARKFEVQERAINLNVLPFRAPKRRS
jgi:hypothetical protein